MHRWFIAIFALHFVVSVSALSLGSAAPSAPTAAALPAPLAIDTSTPAGATKTATALPEQGSPHTLLDELPDLPDSLARAAAVHRPTVIPASERPWQAELPPARVPETPLRPPRNAQA